MVRTGVRHIDSGTECRVPNEQVHADMPLAATDSAHIDVRETARKNDVTREGAQSTSHW